MPPDKRKKRTDPQAAETRPSTEREIENGWGANAPRDWPSPDTGPIAKIPTEEEPKITAESPAEPFLSPKSRKPKSRKPKPQELKVSADHYVRARQYVRGRGYRWERAAGFLHEMRQLHGGMARKIPGEWDQLWAEFWTRPVK